jgi:hypothetical protein
MSPTSNLSNLHEDALMHSQWGSIRKQVLCGSVGGHTSRTSAHYGIVIIIGMFLRIEATLEVDIVEVFGGDVVRVCPNIRSGGRT